MLTVEEFDSLEVGDQIEAGSLFPALSKEPMILQTAQVNSTGDLKEFIVTYLSVTLGRWTCAKKEGVLKWQL